MKKFLALALLAVAVTVRAAAPATDSFTGHFEMAKQTKTVFSLDVLQKGKTATTSFSASNVDGSGAAPDGDGQGAVNDRGELEFKWTDTFDNAGTATLRRDGKAYHLSMKVTKAAEPRCLRFYGDITLKRTSTKPQMSTR
jgi:hypothetical protein